jgi:hypothetical protein
MVRRLVPLSTVVVFTRRWCISTTARVDWGHREIYPRLLCLGPECPLRLVHDLTLISDPAPLSRCLPHRGRPPFPYRWYL